MATPDELAAWQAVNPPALGAGELASPARAQLITAMAKVTAAAPAAAVPVQYGVDLFENNSWFQDSTVAFMILKAYEPGYMNGSAPFPGIDSKFAARWPLVTATGRYRGAYCFGHPGYGASTAGANFGVILNNHGFDPATDRVFLDHEVTDGKSPSYCSGWAHDFCTAVDHVLNLSGDRRCGIYTYQDFIRQGNCAGLGDRPLWLAFYSTAGDVSGAYLGPWGHVSLQQYAVTSIDWDCLAGDAPALKKFWLQAPVPPSGGFAMKGTYKYITNAERQADGTWIVTGYAEQAHGTTIDRALFWEQLDKNGAWVSGPHRLCTVTIG